VSDLEEDDEGDDLGDEDEAVSDVDRKWAETCEKRAQVVLEIKALKKASRKRKKAARIQQAKSQGMGAGSVVTHTTFKSLMSMESAREQEENEDRFQAIAYLQDAARDGHIQAQVLLGNVYMGCIGDHDDGHVHAIQCYESAASGPAPHPDALFNLAKIHFDGVPGHVEEDIPKALDLFRRASDLNDSASMFFLGHVYRVGEPRASLHADMDRALLLLDKAVELGHPGAMFYLAQLFMSGDEDSGVDPDLDRMWKYLRLAELHEDEDALFCLGDLAYNGTYGMKADVTAAMRYFQRAAAQGHSNAMCCLGAMYYNGLGGVKQDYERAFHLYQDAGERGNVEAWKNLASMYALGHGVARNENIAKHILSTLQEEDTE
jgi:TPR repeat protein